MLVVFDLDGTLADCGHRLHHVTEKPKNWKKFFELILQDTPNIPILKLYNSCQWASYTVVLATGRPESTRRDTQTFLDMNHIEGYSDLYMREPKDFRPDHVVKVEQLEKIREKYGQTPNVWFEDKKNVIDALRASGVFVVDVNQDG